MRRIDSASSPDHDGPGRFFGGRRPHALRRVHLLQPRGRRAAGPGGADRSRAPSPPLVQGARPPGLPRRDRARGQPPSVVLDHRGHGRVALLRAHGLPRCRRQPVGESRDRALVRHQRRRPHPARAHRRDPRVGPRARRLRPGGLLGPPRRTGGALRGRAPPPRPALGPGRDRARPAALSLPGGHRGSGRPHARGGQGGAGVRRRAPSPRAPLRSLVPG
jgi:hypothetical protein